MPNAEPVFLVDSYAQIYRGFHAVRNLSTKSGTPTNAVFAMTKFLMRLHRDFPSENGAFVFDKGKPPRRMALLPEYKANRPPMPDELKCQIPVIREMIPAFGWPLIEHEGYEADDLIGSISVTLRDNPVLIFSADKDLAQLIDERVEMMVPDPSGSIKKRGKTETLEKFGVSPKLIADYLALLGDSADNIPGIPGVGPKTAAALLVQFGSGREIFEHPEKIEKDSLRTKIAGCAAQFEKNLQLVLLDLTPPAGTVWELSGLRRGKPDFAKVREICERMELRSIVKEIDAMAYSGLEEAKPESDLFSILSSETKTGKDKNPGGMTQMELF